MPKHHQRPTRHSSTHPRPHPHADIHTPRSTSSQPPSKKPRRPNPLNLYHTVDPPSPPAHPKRGSAGGPPPPDSGKDARFDWDSQERYEYELPDQFVDEEVDEDGAFDEGEEERYGDIVDTILGRRREGKAGKKGRKGKGRVGVKEEEEEEMKEGDEGVDQEGAAGGAVNEDAEMEEGMTTLSALLDEPDEDDEKLPLPKPSQSRLPSKRLRQQRQEEEQEEEEEALGREGDEEEGEEEEDDEELDNADNHEDGDGGEADEYEEVEGEDEEGDEEGVEEEDGADLSDEDDEEDEDPALSSAKRDRLLSMIQHLEAEDQQRKAERETQKSRVAAEDAGLEESEFAAIRMPSSTSASTSSSTGKLTLSALMDSLKGRAATTEGGSPAVSATESRRTLATLKRKLSALTQPATSTKSTATIPLAEPLPEIRQEEITRRLSYATVQKELERWTPIVEHHLTAPTLRFPLHAPPVHQHSSGAMQASFKGDESRQLEKDLKQLLHSMGGGRRGGAEVREEDEGLNARELTAEEVERRRAELGKLKSLLFHSELKARRINQIKSKAYRRLRKKAKERAELSLEELERMDPEEAERRRMKAEVERVKERMSLSHTNSSAWIKRQLRVNQTVNNAEVKTALHSAAALAQRLRKKIDDVDERRGSDDEDEEDVELIAGEEEAEDGEEEEEQKGGSKAAQLKAALRALEREQSSDEEKKEEEEEVVGFDPAEAEGRGRQAQVKASKSGLLNLKFMQKAIEEKRAQAREAREQLEEDLKEELDRAQRDSDEGDTDDTKPQRAQEKQQKGGHLQGRRRLGGGADDGVEQRVEAKAGGGESLLLPGSFQSVSVGLAQGKRVRVDAAVDIDIDAPLDSTAEPRAADLFDVQAFPDDEGITGISSAPLRPKAVSSAVKDSAAATSAATGQSRQDEGARRDATARRQRRERMGQEKEEANPWAQATDVPARRELREEEQKKRRRKRSTASSAEPQVPTNIDVHSVLLPPPSSSTDGAPTLDDVSMEQRALVKEAFALGEDEEANFAQLKAAIVEKSLPIAPSPSALPGWGAWTGDGVQPRPPSQYQQRKEETAQRRLQQRQRQALASRADAGLPAVIISERSDARASKFLLTRLPFPYTSVSAYEQSLRQPLGKEWNSVEAHARVIVPSVVVDKGAIIEPVTFHESARERKAEERKEEERKQKRREQRELQGGGKSSISGQLQGKLTGKVPSKGRGKGRSGNERRGLDGKRRTKTSAAA